MNFRLEFVGSLAEGQRLRLGKDIGHQKIVMLGEFAKRMAKADEVARNEFRSLVNQLVKGMLSIGSWLAPDDRSGLISDLTRFQVHVLTVALHLPS